MQAGLWSGAAACIVLAVASGLAQRRRHNRANMDSVGVVPWPTVQFAALMGAFLLASIAFNV